MITALWLLAYLTITGFAVVLITRGPLRRKRHECVEITRLTDENDALRAELAESVQSHQEDTP